LLQICDHDSIVPKAAVEETEKVLGKYAEVKHYPIGNFDIYMRDNLERSVREQLDFFKKHLWHKTGLFCEGLVPPQGYSEGCSVFPIFRVKWIPHYFESGMPF
jgi:hypothetical protein